MIEHELRIQIIPVSCNVDSISVIGFLCGFTIINLATLFSLSTESLRTLPSILIVIGDKFSITTTFFLIQMYSEHYVWSENPVFNTTHELTETKPA
jgi:hypothetical protein